MARLSLGGRGTTSRDKYRARLLTRHGASDVDHLGGQALVNLHELRTMKYMVAVVDDADPFRSRERGCAVEKKGHGDAICKFTGRGLRDRSPM